MTPANGRLEALFVLHIDFVARMLRNLGVPERDLDDATQQVFIVLARKLAEVRPGAERGFLFRTANNVAAHSRRSLGRKRETLGDLPELPDEQPGADELIDEQRARALLHQVLSGMDAKIRTVFVLYEIERLKLCEIATALDLPPGTAASRLRRAREHFQHEVRRLQYGAAEPRRWPARSPRLANAV